MRPPRSLCMVNIYLTGKSARKHDDVGSMHVNTMLGVRALQVETEEISINP